MSTTQTTPAATTITSTGGVTVSSAPSTLETILQDIFELGVGAASIFVKNPNSQSKAVSIINILKSVFPML